jgi:hypothetical protein
MNWRLLVLATCVAIACVAILAGKDDIDRYLKMRRM